MSEKRPGREMAKWVAVTTAVLLASYAGWYGVMVEPTPGFSEDRSEALVRRPIYDYRTRSGQRRWRAFFTPIHWLDRHLRPHVWKPTE